jgi:hypothetical protein
MAPGKPKKSGKASSSSAAAAPDDEQAQVPSPRRPSASAADSAEPVSSNSVGIAEIRKMCKDLKNDVKTLQQDNSYAKAQIEQLLKDAQKKDIRTELDSIVSRLDRVESKGSIFLFVFCIIICVSICVFCSRGD